MTVKEFINILLDLPMSCNVHFSIDNADKGVVIKSSGDSDIQISDISDGWGGYYDDVIIHISDGYEEYEAE